MPKTLVLFVYHEYNKRVQHFVEKSIFCDSNVDFVLICNGTAPPPNLPSYVHVLIRPNIGFDFGGWSHALLFETEDGKKIYEKYDSFVFVNSSVIGPFLQPGFSGPWTNVFLNGLKGNVKLFGSTINCCDDPLTKAHVQSYLFAMRKETLEYLIAVEIFSTSKYAETFTEAIWGKEVEMSRKVLARGWNIGCLLPQYKGVDFTFTTKKLSAYYNVTWHDVMNRESRNVAWNEYQLVFVKGNRLEIDSIEELKGLEKPTVSSSAMVSIRNLSMRNTNTDWQRNAQSPLVKGLRNASMKLLAIKR